MSLLSWIQSRQLGWNEVVASYRPFEPRSRHRSPPCVFQRIFTSSRNAIHTMQVSTQFKHDGCVNCTSFNSSGDLLLSGSDDTLLKIWRTDMLSASPVAVLGGHRSNIFTGEFLPHFGDRIVVSGSNDADVRVYDLDSNLCRVFRHHVRKVMRVVANPMVPGTFLSCSVDGTVRHFDIRQNYHGSQMEPISTSITVDQEVMPQAFGGGVSQAEGVARENSDSLLMKVEAKGSSSLTCMDFHPSDGHRFIVGSGDGVRLFDLRKVSNDQSYLNFYRSMKVNPRQSDVTGCAFNHNGTELVASHLIDAIYLYDVETNYEKEYGVNYHAWKKRSNRRRRQSGRAQHTSGPQSETDEGGIGINVQPSESVSQGVSMLNSPDSTRREVASSSNQIPKPNPNRCIGLPPTYIEIASLASYLFSHSFLEDRMEDDMEVEGHQEPETAVPSQMVSAPLGVEAAAGSEGDESDGDGVDTHTPTTSNLNSNDVSSQDTLEDSEEEEAAPLLSAEGDVEDDEENNATEYEVGGEDESRELSVGPAELQQLMSQYFRLGAGVVEGEDDQVDSDDDDAEEEYDDGSDYDDCMDTDFDTHRAVYVGHRHWDTLKGVGFYGDQSDYIVSGSDEGNVFIWDKEGQNVVAILQGHMRTVNCVSAHPNLPMLATSGIDSEVLLWESQGPFPPAAELENRKTKYRKIIKNNSKARETESRGCAQQ